MKKTLIVLCVFLFGLAVLFSACSDNKNTNPAKTEGDYNDPNFQGAQGYAEVFVGSIVTAADHSFSYMDYDFQGPLAATSDSTSIIYHESSGWWAIYFHHDDSTSFDVTYTDSVRFTGPDGYQQFPDSASTEGIEYRAHLSSGLVGDSATLSGDYRQNLAITGLQADQVVFTGLSSADMILQNPQSDYSQDIDASLTGVTFNRSDLEIVDGPYPVTGGLTFSMLLNADTPQGSASLDWDVNVTFFIDHYHVRFESGDNYWEWDEPYGG